MTNKNEFASNGFNKVANYVYWFLITNFYFTLSNVLLILLFASAYFSGKSAEIDTNVFFLFSVILSGPATVALLSVMGKLVREKDIDATKDYFTAYKKNFGEGIFWGALILIVLKIVYLDILYFKTKPDLHFLQITLLVIGFLLISSAFYIFPIISRFYLKFYDVAKLSLRYIITKPHITLVNWLVLIGLVVILLKVTVVILLFLWSLLAFAIMFNEKGLLKELEDNIKSKPNG